jgi:hypothetical protein
MKLKSEMVNVVGLASYGAFLRILALCGRTALFSTALQPRVRVTSDKITEFISDDVERTCKLASDSRVFARS